MPCEVTPVSDNVLASGEILERDGAIVNAPVHSDAAAVRTSQLTVLGLLATVGMLFAGFASAYLVRREGTDWMREQLPAILKLNTILLLASSAALEAARWARGRDQSKSLRVWVAASAVLGLTFLGGQVEAWRQLTARGVYLPSSPYSSFFFVLTAVHGVHLLGGIVALVFLLWRVYQSQSILAETGVLDGCATYWHFVDGIWVLLYLLLLFY
jgi:cytochrome c oxidase subunit 3